MSDSTEAKLQEEMHAVFLNSIEPVELPPERARAMQQRLLQRVAASVGKPQVDARGLITIRANEGDWQSLMPKVSMKVLLREGNSLTYLLRLEPGAKVPAHDHPQTEECMVLEGEARIGDLVVRAGDYHAAPAGQPHGLFASESGALLFLRGEVPSVKQLRWTNLGTYAELASSTVRGLFRHQSADR